MNEQTELAAYLPSSSSSSSWYVRKYVCMYIYHVHWSQTKLNLADEMREGGGCENRQVEVSGERRGKKHRDTTVVELSLV